MHPDADEGLGGSLLIYVAALLGGIAVIAVPVYYANAPTVFVNPDTQTVRTILAERAKSGAFPVAILRHADIVSPETAAKLNADVKQPKPRAVAHAAPAREREHSSVAELGYERRSRPALFPFFSLF